MLVVVLKFCFGIALILVASHYLIDHAGKLGRLMRWPEALTGFLILGLGTSAPEIVISIYSSVTGHNELLLGNIIGSNVTNILLIYGLACLFLKKNGAMPVSASESAKDFWVMLLLSCLLCIAMIFGVVPRWFGLILFLITAISFLGRFGFHHRRVKKEKHRKPWLWLRVMVVLLLLLLVMVSADFIVANGLTLAQRWHLTEGVFGAIFVAIGTSLPEIVLAVIAAFNKKAGLVVGTIVGSNISNIGFAVGISSIIKPIINTDMHLMLFSLIMLVATLVFIFAIRLMRIIPRISALLSLLLYILCLAFLIGLF